MMENALYQIAYETARQYSSYVLTTSEGGVFVVDGGYDFNAPELLARLAEITGSEKPHVDAWLLTHAHEDHIDCFSELVASHADEFEFDRVMYCFPSVQHVKKCDPGEEYRTVERFYSLAAAIGDRAVIVTQGDEYEIKGCRIEVLYTFDPCITANDLNNTSTVFRTTSGGKDTIFLGDLGVEGGKRFIECRKDLKTTYCQMAHHGQNGVGREVYEAIAPRALLWSTPLWLWNNDAGKGYDTHIWKTVQVRGWMEEMGVTENYVMKDGTLRVY